MQGLFFFGSNDPVVWESDVEPVFPPIRLDVSPHRWLSCNPDLGTWLLSLRQLLLDGMPIDLTACPVEFRPTAEGYAALLEQPRHPVRTCGIALFPPACRSMAVRLAGDYTMIEELEGRFLLAFADKLNSTDVAEIARATLEFAVDCAYGVAEVFTNVDRDRLGSGRPLAGVRAGRVAEQASALNAILTKDASPVSLRIALKALARLPKFKLYRREAWLRIDQALVLAGADFNLSVRAAVILLRNRMRLTGRYPESRILARPLLIKGLEFDRAVVLDAEKYNAHELYVALTRGRTHVTVVGSRCLAVRLLHLGIGAVLTHSRSMTPRIFPPTVASEHRSYRTYLQNPAGKWAH